MKYLCGCTIESKRGYTGELMKSPIPGAPEVFVDVRTDAAGFQVCPEHGERLYGWATKTVEHQGLGRLLDYNKMGTGKTVRISHTTVDDKRDNRDPETVYRQMKSFSNGHT